MAVAVALIVLVLIVGVNIFLWKSGFLFDAEHPVLKTDVPVKDPKTRQAALTRISRWRAEGRISREEAEAWTRLCEEHWERNEK